MQDASRSRAIFQAGFGGDVELRGTSCGEERGVDEEEHEVNLSSETGQLGQTAASCDDSGARWSRWVEERIIGDAGDGDPGYRVVLCESINAGSRVKERETVENCLYRETETRNRDGKRRLTRAQCGCQGQTRRRLLKLSTAVRWPRVRNADRIRKLGDGRRLKIRTSGSRKGGGGVMDGAGSKEKKKTKRDTAQDQSRYRWLFAVLLGELSLSTIFWIGARGLRRD